MSATIATMVPPENKRAASVSLGISKPDRCVCFTLHGPGGMRDITSFSLMSPERAREIALQLFKLADEAQGIAGSTEEEGE